MIIVRKLAKLKRHKSQKRDSTTTKFTPYRKGHTNKTISQCEIEYKYYNNGRDREGTD